MFLLPSEPVPVVYKYALVGGSQDGAEVCLTQLFDEISYALNCDGFNPMSPEGEHNMRSHGHPYPSGTQFHHYEFKGKMKNDARVMEYTGKKKDIT